MACHFAPGGAFTLCDADHCSRAWKTFSKRLDEAGISWQVYQDKGDGQFAGDTVRSGSALPPRNGSDAV